MQIGRQRGQGGVIAQCGIHGKAAHPGAGVAHGGQGVQQFLVGGTGAHGVLQPVFQPFRDAPQVGKRLRPGALGPEQGQLAAARGVEIGVPPGGVGFSIKGQDGGGHVGGSGVGPAALPELAQGAGTGELHGVRGERLPMARALAGQGNGGHGNAQFEDGLAVFDGKVVVGLVQQGRQLCAGAEGLHGGLPGGGEAAGPGGELCLEGGAVIFAAQDAGGFHQQGSVRCLGPEDQRIAPGGGKDPHPRAGERFGPGTGAGRGQGEDEVGPAGQRGPHPDGLRQQRQRAPLGQPAAHGHGHPPGPQRFCLRQLPRMAVVERIVFSDDTG